jgi:UDP-GlcNAc3NAcA epimerase
MQKEAYFFKKYCLTLRNETEWVELVEQGYNALVGVDSELVRSTFRDLRNKPFNDKGAPYGNGDASVKIARLIETHLKCL